jgi:hypothetical protein
MIRSLTLPERYCDRIWIIRSKQRSQLIHIREAINTDQPSIKWQNTAASDESPALGDLLLYQKRSQTFD